MASTHRGVLIAESLRVSASLELPLAVSRIRRVRVDDPTPVWTLLDFEVSDEDASSLADVLAASLDREGGWYADFGNADLHWVVFADRVFRYVPGDEQARQEAIAYGLGRGVPLEQLDWEE